MQQHLQAIVTVLSLVNPLICGAMFAQIEAGQASATRLADATKAALSLPRWWEQECFTFLASRWTLSRLLAVSCWLGSGSSCCAAIQHRSPMRLEGTRNDRLRR
jgi:hypothetical protein